MALDLKGVSANKIIAERALAIVVRLQTTMALTWFFQVERIFEKVAFEPMGCVLYKKLINSKNPKNLSITYKKRGDSSLSSVLISSSPFESLSPFGSFKRGSTNNEKITPKIYCISPQPREVHKTGDWYSLYEIVFQLESVIPRKIL